jgi:hypothetical protein
MTALSGAQSVDASITVLELRGVKCQHKRGNSVIRCIKLLSNKYGKYANVTDNAETISEPNVKAVVSFKHTSDGTTHLEQLTSLSLGEESRDVHNNSLVMGGVWSSRDEGKNSRFRFSKEIQQVQLAPDRANGKMCIPASVSLQVGLILDGSEAIHPLGVATVLISGFDQTLELCIPVREENQKKDRFSPTKLLASGPSHRFRITSLTMLKIKLDVVARRHQIVATGAVSSEEDDMAKLKTQNKSQISSFKTKAIVALTAMGLTSKGKGAASEHDLPGLTVRSTRMQDGATEIVLNSLPATSEGDAPSVRDDFARVVHVTSKSFDATTFDGEESSVTKTTNVASKSYENESTCSITTETTDLDSKSRGTQETQTSSDNSSSDGLSDVIITASRVTFEESRANDVPIPQSPQRVPSAEEKELFPADVTNQLDNIVRVYSRRVNSEKIDPMDHSASNYNPETGKEFVSKNQSEPRLANVILNSYSADTAGPKEKKSIPVLDTIREAPQSECSESSQNAQSVILVQHKDARYNVEVSVDGDLGNVETSPDRSRAKSQQQFLPSVNPSHLSSQSPTPSIASPVKGFEQGYITIKHTMSSIGDLTVDSALDTITTAPSKSKRFAKNKRRPQRKEAAGFLRSVSLCGTRYDCVEMMDDARVGWKDIIVGDDLCDGCDGFDYVSDDESTTPSLNTMDQSSLLERREFS